MHEVPAKTITMVAMTAAMYDLLDYDEVLEKYDPVMGLEVHVELGTETKMFSTSSAHFGDAPNSNVDPVSLGLPGALPVVNAKGVEWAIKIGLALNCQIAESSRFARKNYFYPDQPKNYQISQYDEPIAYDGYLDVVLDDGTEWRVEIERAHMEEDTGKLTHLGGADGRIHGATASLVDYNRAGIPLIEIVTKPIVGAGERAPEVARVVELVKEGKLTTKLGRKAVDGVLEGEGDVDEVVAKRGLEVVRDDGAIEKAVDDALADNPDIVEKYRAGNKKVTGAIVGAVMKATQGKADPGQVNKLIAEKLAE